MYAQPFTRDKRGESIVCRTSRVRCKMLQMRKWTAANRHNLFAVNDILIQPTQRTSQHQFHPCNHALDIVLVVDLVAGVTLFGRLVQVVMIPWPREFVRMLQCDGTLTSLTQAAASSFSSRRGSLRGGHQTRGDPIDARHGCIYRSIRALFSLCHTQHTLTPSMKHTHTHTHTHQQQQKTHVHLSANKSVASHGPTNIQRISETSFISRGRSRTRRMPHIPPTSTDRRSPVAPQVTTPPSPLVHDAQPHRGPREHAPPFARRQSRSSHESSAASPTDHSTSSATSTGTNTDNQAQVLMQRSRLPVSS